MDEQVRILCVDDEVNVLRALERTFLDEEYEILTALSADEGLTILGQEKGLQIVMSDYRMPGMNGVDFLKIVCRQWPETVRIVLSGYADTAAVVSAINEGQIYKFIPKPWNDDELKVTIANAVERYFLHKRNMQLMEELRGKNKDLEVVNENLEALVQERTRKLEFQNRVLALSRNILDALPAAVVGMDLDGIVVQFNRNAEKMFGVAEGEIVGMNRRNVFPAEVNLFVQKVVDEGCHAGKVPMSGFEVEAKGVLIPFGDHAGVILVLCTGGIS